MTGPKDVSRGLRSLERGETDPYRVVAAYSRIAPELSVTTIPNAEEWRKAGASEAETEAARRWLERGLSVSHAYEVLRTDLEQIFAEAFPDANIDVRYGLLDDRISITWEDGPSLANIQELVSQVVPHEYETGDKTGRPGVEWLLDIRREYSDEAIEAAISRVKDKYSVPGLDLSVELYRGGRLDNVTLHRRNLGESVRRELDHRGTPAEPEPSYTLARRHALQSSAEPRQGAVQRMR